MDKIIPITFTPAAVSAATTLNVFLETAFFATAIAVALWELHRRCTHTKWYKNLKRKLKGKKQYK